MGIRKTAASVLAPLALLACIQSAAAATIEVTKSPHCGCCNQWIEYLRHEGFEVRVTDAEDVTPAARRLGVPDELRSCHTASVEGYAIEGHVPAADIRRLLAERPEAAGIAVPGMPIGSPGMEQGDARQPYSTILFDRNGRREVFARH
ncbi:DUF411 domain-containing protein [Sphingosinicella sp. CPCC 101087]|uniref:DUF411 domain-containing protein n=1 Tax=Sphingosinicella sp. CPCC 101087 TaxID=2497754 RepID=UPI00101C8DA0|nr:DUF411 domain-containing protein [Sphingosinicella sp. CPCC 101087]